ncbi:MAG: hypothetical protein WBK78_08605 [Syntrophomonadaceae bacterium]|jgi:hypothetical protein
MKTAFLFLFICALCIPQYTAALSIKMDLPGVEALTIEIPEGWKAHIDAIGSPEDYPDDPSHIIVIAPHIAEESSGMQSESEPLLTINAEQQLYPLQDSIESFTTSRMMANRDEGRSYIMTGEMKDTGGNIYGFYEVFKESESVKLFAFWNMGARTWQASSYALPEDNDMISTFIAVLKSIRIYEEFQQSVPDYRRQSAPQSEP